MTAQHSPSPVVQAREGAKCVDAGSAPAKYVPQLSEMEGTLSWTGEEPDPFAGQCPPWCSGGRHNIDDEDRCHRGLALFLPLRSLGTRTWSPAEGPSNTTAIDLCMALQQPALHQEPQIRIETPNHPELLLSIDEAEQLLHGLARLIGETVPSVAAAGLTRI